MVCSTTRTHHLEAAQWPQQQIRRSSWSLEGHPLKATSGTRWATSEGPTQRARYMPITTPSNHPLRRPSTPPTQIRMELIFRITTTNSSSSSNIIQPLISRVLWRAWQMTWRTVIWAHFSLKIIMPWLVFKTLLSRRGVVRVIRRIINSKSSSLLSMVEQVQIDRGQQLEMALVKWVTHSPILSNPSRRDSPW